MEKSRVIVITVTYGDRWKFLSQVIDAIINDSFLEKIVIVDNASASGPHIDEYAKKYGARIVVLRNERNEGSAGGFSSGMEYVKTCPCDYVFLLDDDNVPEKRAFPKLVEIAKEYDNKTVIIGNRSNLVGAQDVFLHPEKYASTPRTFFNVFSLTKIRSFFNLFFLSKKKEILIHRRVKVDSFAYGGSFIPRQAIIDAPLPERKLFTYGDDIAYSWGVVDAGYACVACYDVNIHDVDVTFSESGTSSHLTDLLLSTVSSTKAYYRMRNAAYLSSIYSKQVKGTLILSVVVWYIGLLFLFVIKKKKFGRFQIKRAALIAKALRDGVQGNLGRTIL